MEDAWFWETDYWTDPTVPDPADGVTMMDPFTVTGTMNDADLQTDFTVDPTGAQPLTANDTVADGGFFDTLGSMLGDAFKSVTGAAIGAGTAAANKAIADKANSTQNKTTNSSVQNFVSQNGLLIVAGVALIGFVVYANRSR